MRLAIDEERFLTTGQACDYLKISRLTLWRWRRDGLIRARVTPTGKLRFAVRELKELLPREQPNESVLAPA